MYIRQRPLTQRALEREGVGKALTRFIHHQEESNKEMRLGCLGGVISVLPGTKLDPGGQDARPVVGKFIAYYDLHTYIEPVQLVGYLKELWSQASCKAVRERLVRRGTNGLVITVIDGLCQFEHFATPSQSQHQHCASQLLSAQKECPAHFTRYWGVIPLATRMCRRSFWYNN